MSTILIKLTICTSILFIHAYSFQITSIIHDRRKQNVSICSSKGITNRFGLVTLSALKESNESSHYGLTVPNLSIEYCTGCRWLLRASWFMQECLTTFENELGSVILIPSKPPSPGGTFLIKLDDEVLWDRTVEKSFPEAKVIKQRIRDQISPLKDLGHSDVKISGSADQSLTTEAVPSSVGDIKCVECEEAKSMSGKDLGRVDTLKQSSRALSSLPGNVSVEYCNECKWMMKGSWICQEILSTFQNEIHSVTLIPIRSPEEKGTLMVSLRDNILWDQKEDGKAINIEKIKIRLRDIVACDKDLGFDHDLDEKDEQLQEISDDDAADIRSYFGVL